MSLIAHGDQSDVFLMSDGSLVKRTPIRYRQSELRDIMITSVISHPNIVSYTQVSSDDQYIYATLPQMDATLETYQGSDIISLLRQVVDAVTYLHMHGITHNHLSPDNIGINGNHVYLLDFDQAQISTDITKDISDLRSLIGSYDIDIPYTSVQSLPKGWLLQRFIQLFPETDRRDIISILNQLYT